MGLSDELLDRKLQRGGRAPIPDTPTLPYITSFAANENPLSEGGEWRNGQVAGLDWNNMKSVNGAAVGAHIADGPSYDDPIACLTRTFPRGQYIKGIVFVDAGYAPPGSHECELHLLCTITSNSIQSYEFLIDPISETFQIMRWNGTIGDLTPLTVTDHNGGPVPAVDGDEFEFRCDQSGNFSVFQNGVLVWTFTDTTFTSGTPAIAAFWTNAGNDGDRLGWKSIEAGAS